MNYAMIFYLLGWSLYIEAALMLLPSLVAIIYRENTLTDFLIVIAICLVIGFLLTRHRPKNDVIYAREGFISVALIWIFLSAFGALPFVISGSIPSFTDAMFETVSGFTTTGSSILPEVESLTNSILFWRSFTHWIGGMGVLVLLLAVLPLAGGGHNFHLMRAESPGPSVSKLVPKVRTSAMILYLIYFGMTILQIILLLCAKMPLFDSLVTTFGSAGTGGFGIKNDSMASYTPAIQTITGVFMMLFGVNFTAYYLILAKRPKDALKSEEVRAYLAIILVSTLLIAFDARAAFTSVGDALNKAFFQVSSIITTTGFTSANFDLWPSFSKSILVVLMFVGACAGSTGGGLKVSRIVIWVKNLFRELQQMIHPRSVRKVSFEGHTLSDDTIKSVGTYLFTYFLIFVASILIISLDEFDLTTNFTAVAATFNNIGPGLSMVGPTGNFGHFSDLSKWVLTFDMLAGRLELFPMLILLSPRAWKK